MQHVQHKRGCEYADRENKTTLSCTRTPCRTRHLRLTLARAQFPGHALGGDHNRHGVNNNAVPLA
eukprot:1029617-Lingulodinium_polyedra.AAC.1